MGTVNNLALICPFLKFYKFAGNQLLGKFAGNEDLVLPIPRLVKDDLVVCVKVAIQAQTGLPIASRPCPPPLTALHFFSDAAGSKFSLHRGIRVNQNEKNDRGVACVWQNEDAVSWYCTHTWPMFLLNNALDSKGAYFGSKMVTLECVGLLLPFLCIPGSLSGKVVVFHVDNIAVVYGWHNGASKIDEEASILLRGLHLMAAFLGTTVHVQHEPRRSSDLSILADNLSRKSTTSKDDLVRLSVAKRSSLGRSLNSWLGRPTTDWSLPSKFLEDVKLLIKAKS
jgi:hypothetical protein